MTGLAFRSLTAAREADIVALFDRPGVQRQCWCMVWRATEAEGRGTPAALRREQFLGRVRAGLPVGVVGYAEGVPVAWVSIAPKASYRRLEPAVPKARLGSGRRSEEATGSADDGVWSIACLFVRRDFRGRGISHALIGAAVEEARRQGASVVEGYPVDPDSPSFRYMGFVEAYVRAGFTEAGRIGLRRHRMRLALGAAGSGNACDSDRGG